MNITSAINIATRCIDRRCTIPILEHVRVTVDGGLIRFTGTDMDRVNSAITNCDAPPMDVMLPARPLAAFAKGADSLNITLSEKKATIDAGNRQIVLPTLETDGFPVFAQQENPATFSYIANVIVEALETVRHAISREETRYYLNGTYAHNHEGQLRFVATDGRRLACIDTLIPVPDNMPAGIWRKSAIDDVIATFKSSRQILTVKQSASILSVETPTTSLVSKMIDGCFLDYHQVIPTQNDKSMRITVDEIKSITSGLKGKEKNDCIRFDGDTIAIGSRSTRSENTSPIQIGFNAAYLLDMAKAIGGNSFTLMCDAHNCPAVANKGPLTYVLMPM